VISPSPAEKLLLSYGITGPAEIDLEAIAYDQGALVRYESLEGCEARILGTGNRAVITVEENQRRERQRFSTAHELGHWHHHRGKSFICRTEDIGNPVNRALNPERVADNYAADLLMPRYLFAPAANQFKRNDFGTVSELMAMFTTSLTATTLRLVEYGPEYSMIICHGTNGRKWFRRNPEIPDHWFPVNELDSDSYSFDVVFGNQTQSRRHKIPAEAWFDCRAARDFEVYEEARSIGRDQVLILLTFRDLAALDG
jgi:Zn-dependent peptidase ImmA (M78 family)